MGGALQTAVVSNIVAALLVSQGVYGSGGGFRPVFGARTVLPVLPTSFPSRGYCRVVPPDDNMMVQGKGFCWWLLGLPKV